jgi:Uma2 family endonuclease
MGKAAARPKKPVPPLREGDRLSRAEFIRRYEYTPQVTRAELIDGVVHIIAGLPVHNGKETGMPPISLEGHGTPHFQINTLLGNYVGHTPFVIGSGPTSVYSPSDDSMPEPDTTLYLSPEAGGRTVADSRGFVHGAPELVVEVSNTTVALDMGPKFDRYYADGVEEYLVWRTQLRAVDWYRRGPTQFVPIEAGEDGTLASQVFPGLWLDPEALVSGNLFRVLQVCQLGLASPEHAAFVAKLKRRTARKKK